MIENMFNILDTIRQFDKLKPHIVFVLLNVVKYFLYLSLMLRVNNSTKKK